MEGHSLVASADAPTVIHTSSRKRPNYDETRDIHAHIESINASSPSQFAHRYCPQLRNTFTTKDGNADIDVELYAASELSSADFMACFQLLKHTSFAAYKSSSRGWRPEAKKAEMRDEDMRYLLVRRFSNDGAVGAFLSFMLTIEDDFPVIYVYEIHLASGMRRCGLGKRLMHIVEDIGCRARVAKAMLTVFTSNSRAEGFYRNLGYTDDEFSPRPRKLRRGVTKRPDYIIMSKSLNPSDALLEGG